MSNHSKGPWKIVEFDSYNSIVDADGVELMCDLDYYPSVPSKGEDWDLIAAGPELLSALQEQLRNFEAQHAMLIELGNPQFVGMRDNARAAIAKALGEKS
jgi:hypothetical protein